MFQSTWAEETEQEFRLLWQQGKPFSAIAKQLQISRSAAVGKAFRLGLKRGNTKRADGPKKKPVKRIKREVVPANKPALVTASHPVACTIFELSYRSCRFPLWSDEGGEPISEKFYCGAPSELSLAYCRKHVSCTTPRAFRGRGEAAE